MSHLTYEQLLDAADQEGLAVKEQPLSTHDGLIIGSHIAIWKYITCLQIWLQELT